MLYRNNNSSIKYIINNSNHPMIVRKNLPKIVKERLNKLSIDQKTFKNVKSNNQVANLTSNTSWNTQIRPTLLIKKSNEQQRLCSSTPYCQSLITIIKNFFWQWIHIFKTRAWKRFLTEKNCKKSNCCLENFKSLIICHKKVLNRTNNKKTKTIVCATTAALIPAP